MIDRFGNGLGNIALINTKVGRRWIRYITGLPLIRITDYRGGTQNGIRWSVSP